MAWAHSANDLGEWDPLSRHLRDVASLAHAFGEPLALGRESYWAGLLHDLGKYDQDFQRRLRDPTISAPHAAYGACIAIDASSYEVAFAVAAHHAGLCDRAAIGTLPRARPPRYPSGPDYGERARALRVAALTDLPELSEDPPRTTGTATAEGKEALDLRVRLLLSCLIDADRLDTEAFYSTERSFARSQDFPSMGELADRVERFIARLQARAVPSPVNEVRAEVLEACKSAARARPGLSSLTVPTGGGKTLASLLYALRHAQIHGLRRVIVVVPFLAIIEQNAAVIRRALVAPPDLATGRVPIVLEHHSAVLADGVTLRGGAIARLDMSLTEGDEHDPQGGIGIWRRLAAENWDAPVVVTTAVQFLESLFSSRPSRVRKLHRIARSAVVFDEVQTLPAGLLQPILRMLQQMQTEYGTSFLFCTATQPAFEARSENAAEGRWRPGEVHEVVPDPASMFRRMRRVAVTWPKPGEALSWSALAERLVKDRQALAIVNTRDQARRLFDAVRAARADLPAGEGAIVHLSSRVCPRHRTITLDRVRTALRTGAVCIVAATQLVEAGVDLDFPVVYRALGPLDSVAQAAGRANREGRLRDANGAPVFGQVVVFQPEDESLPPGVYRTATDITQSLLHELEGTSSAPSLDLDDPSLYQRYFERLYNVANLDVPGIGRMRQELEFRRVDDSFRIIDDDTQGVAVPYGEGTKLIDAIRSGRPVDRALQRQLQPYTVNLYRHEFAVALGNGALEELSGGAVFAAFPGNYDDDLGFINVVDAMDYVV